MKFFISTLLLGAFSTAALASSASDWSNMTQPTKLGVMAQSIGKYDGGCVSGAITLPMDGTGYQVMRLSRRRYFGHPDLIHFIENFGRTVSDQKLGTLLVGDLGQPRGGPTLSGHRSHQTGLDVDIWFSLPQVATTRKLDASERETWGATSMLVSQSDAIDEKQWTAQHEKVLEAASRMPEVDRIFVNPSIKRLLCTRKTSHDWLRKIRPWWKHDDHFHVRLKCPDNSNNCTSQASLPDNDGCDASLDYWFSAEAKKPKIPSPKPKAPKLPTLCDSVLSEN
ncbi:Penicillin-insensitive murein endopeptidase [Crenothrix polyspora]|jgi:penicillin-insensitive murein endopeptidase|uniref:Penicillin-insensitive murein endopeptidase n=1 Tax=Crenothrix polyspora TaxID=360316 RepID=A0A1R4HEA4_9GAMM|nr:penicillin-insensitive murein endopeptidase [Crenothrix polyspora]SJM94562.1 Penicillin-insensitive murein endopeptidase [Crenothrix polyspora]